jgi:hypothetical protein
MDVRIKSNKHEFDGRILPYCAAPKLSNHHIFVKLQKVNVAIDVVGTSRRNPNGAMLPSLWHGEELIHAHASKMFRRKIDAKHQLISVCDRGSLRLNRMYGSSPT